MGSQPTTFILKTDWQKGKTAIDSSLKKWGQIVIVKSAGEDLWIGTWRNGLLKKSGRTGAISAYDEFLNANPNSLKQVTFLLPEKEKLWVGTAQN